MTEEVRVKVLLNQNIRHSFILGYQPGDQLLQAIAFDCPLPACGRIDHLLEIIFRQLNIGGDPSFGVPAAEWTKVYRAKGHRSLSVGDVVVIGEQAWAVGGIRDDTGWVAVSVEASQVWFDVGRIADE